MRCKWGELYGDDHIDGRPAGSKPDGQRYGSRQASVRGRAQNAGMFEGANDTIRSCRIAARSLPVRKKLPGLAKNGVEA